MPGAASKSSQQNKTSLEISVITAGVTLEFLFNFRTRLIYNAEEEWLWRESE